LLGLSSHIGFDDERSFQPRQKAGQSLEEYLSEAYGVKE